MPVTLELIGTRVHPEDVPLLHEMIDRARGDGSDFEYEHRLLMPDHSVKYLHVVAHATRDQDGRLEYIGAVQDVTERRLSEEALGRVRSELAHVARVTSLGALTASIAHEVNQPLSGIITNASTCLRMLAADPPECRGRARNRAAHDSRRQPRVGCDHAVARALRQEGGDDRSGGPERGGARGDCAVAERTAEKPGDSAARAADDLPPSPAIASSFSRSF